MRRQIRSGGSFESVTRRMLAQADVSADGCGSSARYSGAVPALYLVIPLALLFAMLAIGAFVWSARSGQFDDLDGPAERILHEDDGERDDTRSN